MSALATSLVVCAFMLAGALFGVLLRRILPANHLNEHSKDVVRLGCGLIATISALVLGLLITSAKNTYDTQRNEVRQMTANVILLDRQLNRYGPETRPAREALRSAIEPTIGRIWGKSAEKPLTKTPFESSAVGELVYTDLQELSPQNEGQRTLKSQALQTANNITESRVMLFEQSDGAMPVALLVVLAFWLTILFSSFTLFSPLNPTACVAVAIIALSASGAIFLIQEMNTPFSGLMQISNAPVRNALAPLGPR
jgi:Protein of unknown function (DUF4239)